MWRDSNTKKQVAIGVATSVVAAVFIQPFLGFLWRTLNSLGSTAAVELSNIVYRNAALGFREHYSFMLLLFTFVTLLGVVTSAAVVPFFFLRRAVRAESSGATKNPFRRLRKPFKVLVLLCATLAAVWLLTVEFADLQLNASFNQRVSAIGPALNDVEEKQLRSRWALMKSRADYESINRDIERIARENSIDVPKPLWD